MFVQALQTSIDGLLIGACYGLTALGFAFLYFTVRRLDFAYGVCIMAALYCVVSYAGTSTLSIGASLVIALPVAALVLAYSQWICFPPNLDPPPVVAIAASFAIWMQVQEVVTLFMPQHSYAFPSTIAARDVWISGIAVRVDLILIALLVVALAFLLSLFLRGTREGRAVRAFTQNPKAAALTGVSPSKVWLWTWLISVTLGVIGALAIASIEQAITPMFGFTITLKALLAIAIGGTTTIKGPLIGGFVLGLVEAYLQSLFGPQVREFLIYVLLLAWLALSSWYGSRHANAAGKVRATG